MIEGQSINDIDLQSNEVHFKALEKPYSKHTGWTLYECEYYEMIEVPAGTSYTVNDSNAVTYYFDTIINEADIEMDRYIVLWYPTLIDQDMTTEELFAYKCIKSYYGVANWKEEKWTFQDKTVEENPNGVYLFQIIIVFGRKFFVELLRKHPYTVKNSSGFKMVFLIIFILQFNV